MDSCLKYSKMIVDFVYEFLLFLNLDIIYIEFYLKRLLEYSFEKFIRIYCWIN